jgi:hypothetical protein
MVKPEIIEQLQADLSRYQRVLGQAADTILEQDVSEYPIFVFHQQEQAPGIGIPMIDREQVQEPWSVHASTLEELAMKRLIEDEKLEAFRKVFKNPRQQLCLFVLHEDSAGFIFVPRTWRPTKD